MKIQFALAFLLFFATAYKSVADTTDPVDPFIPQCSNFSAYFEVDARHANTIINSMHAMSSMPLNAVVVVQLASRPITLLSVSVDESYARMHGLNALNVASYGLASFPQYISRVTVRICPTE